MQNQKVMVDSGQWLLYRFNPARFREGQNPLQLDSRMPKLPVEKFLYLENRFRMLTKSKPEEAKRLMEEVQQDVYVRWQLYEYLSAYKKAQDPRKESGPIQG